MRQSLKEIEPFWFWFYSFCALHIVWSLWMNAHGAFLIDTNIYQMMVRDFFRSGHFNIIPYYHTFPSDTFIVSGFMQESRGRIYPQYPSLLAVLAWPFYLLFGEMALFVMNALAFLGVLYLIYKIILILFMREDMARMAMVIFGVASYAWGY